MRNNKSIKTFEIAGKIISQKLSVESLLHQLEDIYRIKLTLFNVDQLKVLSCLNYNIESKSQRLMYNYFYEKYANSSKLEEEEINISIKKITQKIEKDFVDINLMNLLQNDVKLLENKT